jgi:pyruvate,water dikinase
MSELAKYILDFAEIGMSDLARVGGKNASLGEMFNQLKPKGVGVTDGFAATAAAYWRLLEEAGLRNRLQSIFANLDVEDAVQLAASGHRARTAVLETAIPQDVRDAILDAYDRLCRRAGREVEVAVRSSATAEDLPEASFAGAAETYLNVRGKEALIRAVHNCYASLFTDRAINYRARLGYEQLKVALSIGVMPMIRSDKASSGVIFTLDPESGFRDVVVISSSYGLGEFIVQGVVNPDEWTVFKPTLSQNRRAIIGRRLGTKEVRLVYGDGNRTTRSEATPPESRATFSLTDEEVLQLARWACIVEEHYSNRAQRPQPMDLEWAKDGLSGQLFIVQARPETVHSAKPRVASAEVYRLRETPAAPLVRGQAVGEKVGVGAAHVVREPSELGWPNSACGDRLARVWCAVHCRCWKRNICTTDRPRCDRVVL